MRTLACSLVLLGSLSGGHAYADYLITRDHGGSIESYKSKYSEIRDRDERVVIDGACDSACTLVLGIVPLKRICVTPRATLGFHMAYYDLAATDGALVVSYQGSAEFMSLYPQAIKEWLLRHGGLTPEAKFLNNGPELWAIVDPCPEEVF
jgi:hypothetical protein